MIQHIVLENIPSTGSCARLWEYRGGVRQKGFAVGEVPIEWGKIKLVSK